jgi:hypothetical protein
MGQAVGNLWQAWAQSLTQSNLRQMRARGSIRIRRKQIVYTLCVHQIPTGELIGPRDKREHNFARTRAATHRGANNGKLLRDDDVHDDFYEMR